MNDVRSEIIAFQGLSLVPNGDGEAQETKIPDSAVCFFKDGDDWCCVFGDFINLQESFAGFGKTFDDALSDLRRRSKENQ